MQTKLTLRLDDRLIARAKVWARSRNVSLSQAVAAFFAQLPEPGDQPQLSPWTQRLAGIGRVPDTPAPSDDRLREAYLDHLDAKHR